MTLEPGQQPQAPAPQPGPAPAGRPPMQPPMQQPVVPSFIPPSVAASAVAPRSKSRVSAGTVAFVVAIVVAAAGLGFAGGRVTAPQSSARAAFQAGGFGNGNGAANPNGGAGRTGGLGAFAAGDIAVTGQVTAIADGSMTIQTSAGQSVTVAVPSTVTYHAQTGASSSDVTVGSNVQLTVTRPNGFRGGAEASGAPAPSAGAFQLSATDVTVLGK